MTEGKPRQRGRRSLAVLAFAAVLGVIGACSEEGDDLAPSEPEVGEEDAEIVPGEGGPVD